MKILKSLISGIGALPVDFKGKINNKSFIVKVQFKIDGSAAAQIWSDQKVILEVEGRAGEQTGLAQKFLNFATPDKEDQDVYKKTAKDFINQLHKEVKEYNRKKGVKKKAVESVKPVRLGPSKYYLYVPPAEGEPENWFLKKGMKIVDIDGFPRGRFVVGNIPGQGKYIFDTVHGFSIMSVDFGIEEAIERINKGLAKIDDKEKFLADHAEKVTNKKKAEGTWQPKPSLTGSKTTTVRKKATTTRKATTAKKATTRKATTKKATTRKATAKKATTSSSRQTGSSNALYDARKSAMAPGKRKSSSGATYYEYRKNRSDKPGSKI